MTGATDITLATWFEQQLARAATGSVAIVVHGKRIAISHVRRKSPRSIYFRGRADDDSDVEFRPREATVENGRD